ncbi:DUF971 domain-containing protein [candidate division KSB1 bacterium]|nr:DUF971 domain-containing protein [candidate division KSB1 bacterium]NIR72681.1 DUF971 domain-containing protein [candidate division KSB1 bacterium]NIS28208.1 DUF971 domain-containing protein [candidate division KSB1 bacterium]NIT75097.1 DUF971 domain-containing protein [candidate division KSB1 bacterium]NIU28884.1 DUF971 domain-containing protein [candidate division KSB1 bacterium]
MNKKTFAKQVSVSTEEQTMTIVWADGHRSDFPLEGLRRACPCVTCAGGHENMGEPVDPAIFEQPPTQTWMITELREVGNYAVQIVWGDGHDTGIYRWESLRDMCPCEECQRGL